MKARENVSHEQPTPERAAPYPRGPGTSPCSLRPLWSVRDFRFVRVGSPASGQPLVRHGFLPFNSDHRLRVAGRGAFRHGSEKKTQHRFNLATRDASEIVIEAVNFTTIVHTFIKVFGKFWSRFEVENGQSYGNSA